MLEDYLKRIFDGNQELIDAVIWKHNFTSLEQAVTSVIGDISKLAFDSADYKLAMALRENAAVFAAFKNHTEQSEIVKLLVGEAGERRSWNDFKKLADPLTELYNKTWLETEYNQAMTNAEMAKKWADFEENADQYPNLQYRAVMDAKTRDEHRKLNGTILPVNDPFWKIYYPPNGWGCRCSVTQTSKKPFKPESIEGVTPDKGFDFNPGIDKKLFSDSAGYYNQDKKTSGTIKKTAKTLLKKIGSDE